MLDSDSASAADAIPNEMFAALQEMAAAREPSRYAGARGVEGQQKDARKAALQSIGKTPKELDAAIEKRTSESEVNYEAAYSQSIARDPELAYSLRR